MEIPPQTVRLNDGRSAALRSLTARDAPQLIRYLLAMSAATEYMTRYPEEVDADPASQAARLSAAAQSRTNAFLGCFVQGRLVGNLGLYQAEDRLRTRHRCTVGLGVLPGWQGLGIGTALLRGALDCARAAGYEQMELTVVTENAPARHLYEKLGFAVTGAIPHAYKNKAGRYYDFYYMVCPLAAEPPQP